MNSSAARCLILLGIALLTFDGSVLAQPTTSRAMRPATGEIAARRELVGAVFAWIEATNDRDFAAQSIFYPTTMEAFYLWRDVPRSAVLAEKRRIFESAEIIDIKADAPQIIIDAGGQTARLYFRKYYKIYGASRKRNGEVLQELRWARQPDGWKIVSERDLRVIRSERERVK